MGDGFSMYEVACLCFVDTDRQVTSQNCRCKIATLFRTIDTITALRRGRERHKGFFAGFRVHYKKRSIVPVKSLGHHKHIPAHKQLRHSIGCGFGDREFASINRDRTVNMHIVCVVDCRKLCAEADKGQLRILVDKAKLLNRADFYVVVFGIILVGNQRGELIGFYITKVQASETSDCQRFSILGNVNAVWERIKSSVRSS